VPGMEKIQFISRRPDCVQIDYMAPHNIDTSLETEFQHLLNLRGASRTTFNVRRVRDIPNDPQTGKFRPVRIEFDPTSAIDITST